MSSNIAQHLQQLKQNNLSSLSLSSLGFPLENSANGICLSSSSSSFPLYSTLRENGTGKGGRPGPGMDIAAGIGYNGFFLSLWEGEEKKEEHEREKEGCNAKFFQNC